jgi:hypothetical protein
MHTVISSYDDTNMYATIMKKIMSTTRVEVVDIY